MFRSLALGAFALGIAFAPHLTAAEPVTQVVTVQLMPGKLDAYRAEVKKLMAALVRLGSKARLRLFETTAAGENAGNFLVAVEYESQAAWATDSTKTQNDAEWQEIVGGLSGMRTVVSTALWRDISPTPAEGPITGGVVVVTAVAVQPGKLEDYRTRVGNAQAIIRRLGLKSQPRIWQAELAGPAAGSVVVTTQYPDLPTYVADQAKLNADPEWQKFLSGLDTVRTLQGRSLYREIAP